MTAALNCHQSCWRRRKRVVGRLYCIVQNCHSRPSCWATGSESWRHHLTFPPVAGLELTSSRTAPPVGVELEPIGETTEEQTLKLNYTLTLGEVRRRRRRRWHKILEWKENIVRTLHYNSNETVRHQIHCKTSGFFSLFSSTLSMNCFARMVNFSFSWTISVT